MTIFTENATHLKSTKSRNSNSSLQVKIIPASHFEFVLRSRKIRVIRFGGFWGCCIFSGKRRSATLRCHGIMRHCQGIALRHICVVIRCQECGISTAFPHIYVARCNVALRHIYVSRYDSHQKGPIVTNVNNKSCHKY